MGAMPTIELGNGARDVSFKLPIVPMPLFVAIRWHEDADGDSRLTSSTPYHVSRSLANHGLTN